METGRRSERLHFHLAHRLQRAARADRRHHDRRLLRLSPHGSSNVAALYQADGEYRYTNGFSVVALVALVVGVLPNLPGFLVHDQSASMPTACRAFLVRLYNYAWFIGFGIAFVVYLVLRKLSFAKRMRRHLRNAALKPPDHHRHL